MSKIFIKNATAISTLRNHYIMTRYYLEQGVANNTTLVLLTTVYKSPVYRIFYRKLLFAESLKAVDLIHLHERQVVIGSWI